MPTIEELRKKAAMSGCDCTEGGGPDCLCGHKDRIRELEAALAAARQQIDRHHTYPRPTFSPKCSVCFPDDGTPGSCSHEDWEYDAASGHEVDWHDPAAETAQCSCGKAPEIHPEEAHETRYEMVEGCERPYVWCIICSRECLPEEDFA